MLCEFSLQFNDVFDDGAGIDEKNKYLVYCTKFDEIHAERKTQQ